MAEVKISLAAARVNACMTQDEVAQALQVNTATIISWEKGRTKIPFVSLIQLCELYEFPIDNIFLPSELTKS